MIWWNPPKAVSHPAWRTALTSANHGFPWLKPSLSGKPSNWVVKIHFWRPL